MSIRANWMKQLLNLTIGAVIYTVIFQFFYCWMRYGSPFPLSAIEMLVSMAYNFGPIYFLIICNYLLIFKLTAGKRPIIGAVLSFSLSMVWLVVICFMFKLITGLPVEYAGTVFCNLLVYAALETIYYAQVSKEMLRQQALQKQETLLYKFEALKAQVNPHFLFNSLNILYSFIPPADADARDYVLHLSRVYRYTLNHSDKPSVTVREELNFLDSYNQILRIRFHDNFRVDITDIPDADERKIIPFSLQMLIENVTKHNMISSDMPMTVTIQANDNGISITNPIRHKDSDVSNHFGLTYLSRLYDYHGKKFSTIQDTYQFKAFVPFI